MRQNYVNQTSNYGGNLLFNATSSFAFQVSIPLFIKTIDIPVRKPRITEISTIPTYDENLVSDWSTQAIFMGGQQMLSTTMDGFFLTPTTTVTDPITGAKYAQLNPTTDGTASGTSLGLTGYSYGDIIWAYISGRLNNVNNRFIRTDPSQYTDPFGNVYKTVVIQQFECNYTQTITMQTFSMTLYLEV